jgi:hypothetical protein
MQVRDLVFVPWGSEGVIKAENMQRKLATWCCYSFVCHFDTLLNYDLILSCLNFRTLYSRQHLNALFVIDVFKDRSSCYSVTDAVGISVPSEQIREFLTFIVSSDLQPVAPLLHTTCADFWEFLGKTLFPLRTPPPCE